MRRGGFSQICKAGEDRGLVLEVQQHSPGLGFMDQGGGIQLEYDRVAEAAGRGLGFLGGGRQFPGGCGYSQDIDKSQGLRLGEKSGLGMLGQNRVNLPGTRQRRRGQIKTGFTLGPQE